MNFSVAKVVISGSFRRDLTSLRQQYRELIETNCQVLSPRSIEFDDGSFVRSRGEQALNIRTIQDNHLASLHDADFVWLHCPEGYVGTSGAFEIGFAYAHGIPVYSATAPNDAMLSEYVTTCPSVYKAKQLALDRE